MEEAARADRVVVMDGGRIRMSGKAALYAESTIHIGTQCGGASE